MKEEFTPRAIVSKTIYHFLVFEATNIFVMISNENRLISVAELLEL